MPQQARRQRVQWFERRSSGAIRLCDVAARSARRCCASHLLEPCMCAPRILRPRHMHECEHTLTRCRSHSVRAMAGSLRQWGRRAAPSDEVPLQLASRCAAARSNACAPPHFLLLTIHPCSTRLQVDGATAAVAAVVTISTIAAAADDVTVVVTVATVGAVVVLFCRFCCCSRHRCHRRRCRRRRCRRQRRSRRSQA